MSRKKERRRKAGILYPVSSLPGSHGIGGIGPDAEEFLDWAKKGGITQWELLPLNPTSYGNSSYQSPCSCAGNPNLISAKRLIEYGYLAKEELQQSGLPENNSIIDYGRLFQDWNRLLREKAYPRFAAKGGDRTPEYHAFCQKHSAWLDEYALFMAIKEAYAYKPWWEWPRVLADRDGPTLAEFKKSHKEGLGFWKFTQFIFFRQWDTIRAYARRNGIEIIGDLPFYVAPDSVDAWSRRELFAINAETNQVEMWAGVPADHITGKDRNWGNPVYRWTAHKAEGYSWFRQRMRQCGFMYDVLRIDHVIAAMRYYGIKAGEEKGSWYDGPDMSAGKLSDAINEEAVKLGLDIIAEDLGSVPPGLRENLQKLGWSGMRVLQYAYTGKYGAKSNHLPLYHTADMVVYTGTHDNPTLKEFLAGKTDKELRYMRWWTRAGSREELRWAMIREAYKSPADQVIIPIQDILGLGQEGRMVFQDSIEKSWCWRLADASMLSDDLAKKMRRLAVLTGRLDADEKEFDSILNEKEGLN